jgi:hypothetical protein
MDCFFLGKILLGRSQVRQIALERKEALNEYCQVLIYIFICNSQNLHRL